MVGTVGATEMPPLSIPVAGYREQGGEGRERDSIQAYRKLKSPVEYLESHFTLGSLTSSDGVTQLI